MVFFFFASNLAYCLIYGTFLRDLIKGYSQVVSRLHSVSARHTRALDFEVHCSVQHSPATELKRETKVYVSFVIFVYLLTMSSPISTTALNTFDT